MNIKKQIQSIQNSAVNDPRFKNNEEVEVTKDDAAFVNKLFNSILPQFPAWRQTCPTEDDLNRLKMAWSKAIKRHMIKSGKALNVKAGLIACEESESDWIPSVGKFIKWCDQSNDLLPLAQRALDLFNSAQRQVDTVGQMVVAKHKFDLKQMKAADTGKRFIELYLSYAENNAVEPLDAFAITETVQLSLEQQKDRDKRTEVAKNEFFSKFDAFTEKNPSISPESVEKAIEDAHGIKQGSLKEYRKTPAQLEEEKQRQLKAIEGMK